MKKIYFLFVSLLYVVLIQSQDQILLKYSSTITQEDLKKHLSIIASDEYEGRYTGDIGLEKAAKYLESEFAGDKLTGPVTAGSNPFYQEFELEKKSWTNIKLVSGKNSFENGTDFYSLNLVEGINEYDLVFAGYGIYSDKYNDYKNIDLKDKIVVFLQGEPQTKAGKYLVTGSDSASIKQDTSLLGKLNGIQPKIMASMMRKAKGVIIVEPDEKSAEKTISFLDVNMGNSQLTFPGKSGMMPPFPMIYMSKKSALKMFDLNNKKFDKAIREKIEIGESPAGMYSTKLKIEASRKTDTVKTGNVIAVIEGSDKKDEYLTITAHYDHLGVKKGDVYNGADDNGSGTVALLEIAEAFAKAKAEGNGPRRSILFIAFTGEEVGLFGSKYYTDKPVFPMANTVANLNIDMIGRIDKFHTDGNYIHLIGSDRLSQELHQTSENIAKIYAPELVLDYKHNAKNDPENLYQRSDHYNFALKKVPVIFYTSGDHADYHKMTDDVDEIDFASYNKRVQLIFATAWQLANADERVKLDKK